MSNGTSDRIAEADRSQVEIAGRTWPVKLVRHARAKRLTLRFDRLKGEVRLSLPATYSPDRALAWVAGQHRWLQGQIGSIADIVAVGDGTALPYLGERVTILWQEGAPRRVALSDDRLIVGGPPDGVSRRVERWLRDEALALLSDETHHYAHRAGLKAGRISVADPKSRWGSCASDGTIRYNWRLILAPDFVRRATVAHEVAHLAHMHHGPEFHALVDEIFEGSARRARRWLKAEGHTLHHYRFD